MPAVPSVVEAMRETPRAGYLPSGSRRLARIDAPVELGHGSTCSQPSTVRTMLELLDVREGQSVLDVGSGSGWTTAILARLVGPTGRVLGVEVVEELVQDAAGRLRRDGLDRAAVRVADPDVLGAPDAAPFDRILVSAMARELPGALVDQLAADGLMVLPLEGQVVSVRVEDDRPRLEPAPGWYRFVPLRTQP
ncbi:protein-L-isoaspartate O-methyltransferase family protein [Ornithinimicrobium avium]|uniref:Protein-L-isoaspartate O-methyltransferase n=1 Tax=Ornithinimicrobium avium TaxID=2283195 RepID=A0A345NPW4_9MICO|nr:methyltransferase domain-containing protein [Ornithinimicrobium avium]AXH97072.1 methyltransferase domain-containing protein [Ornithinimicrobium avium]